MKVPGFLGSMIFDKKELRVSNGKIFLEYINLQCHAIVGMLAHCKTNHSDPAFLDHVNEEAFSWIYQTQPDFFENVSGIDAFIEKNPEFQKNPEFKDILQQLQTIENLHGRVSSWMEGYNNLGLIGKRTLSSRLSGFNKHDYELVRRLVDQVDSWLKGNFGVNNGIILESKKLKDIPFVMFTLVSQEIIVCVASSSKALEPRFCVRTNSANSTSFGGTAILKHSETPQIVDSIALNFKPIFEPNTGGRVLPRNKIKKRQATIKFVRTLGTVCEIYAKISHESCS